MSADGTSAPAPKGPTPHELLLRELDDRNQNSRAAMQAFIAWYTFFVTTNLGVIGLALTNADKITAVRSFVSGLFILINVLAILATLALMWANAVQDARIADIVRELKRCSPAPAAGEQAEPRVEMASSYPYWLILALLALVLISLAVITSFWYVFPLPGAPTPPAG